MTVNGVRMVINWNQGMMEEAASMYLINAYFFPVLTELHLPLQQQWKKIFSGHKIPDSP